MTARLVALASFFFLVVLLAVVPVGGTRIPEGVRAMPTSRSAPPGDGRPLEAPVNLVFLHHSVGAQLLADPGPEDPKQRTHPNGGGLRKLLEGNGYRVHEATYGSALGEHTDLFDWLPRFTEKMDDVLATAHQDERLPAGETNRVVLFKSCFPNNWFAGPGTEPGNPRGPELTEANARAALGSLLPLFARHPDVLFVYLTAPPLAPVAKAEPAYKWLARKALGRPTLAEKLRIAGASARRFNDWAASPDGWLAGHPGNNVAVFHLFDVLTEGAASGLSHYPSGNDGKDDHPSSEGNRKAAEALVPFLNAAVRRAGIVGTERAPR